MRLRGRREGATRATYAAVLDGIHLWLDVEGPVSVRDVDTGQVTELGGSPCDLSGLAGRAYDVLAASTPVHLAATRPPGWSRTPLSPDGSVQWEVGGEGPLRLTRHPMAPTAELDAVEVREDRVHLRLRPPGAVTPGWHLLLLDPDDQVRATLPVTAHEGRVEALIGVDDLPAGYFGVLRVAIGTDTDRMRVRRRGNDLPDPNRAVLLPELHDARETPRARLRWNPDGLLALRTIAPDEAG